MSRLYMSFRARQHQRSLAPVMNDYDGQMIFGDLVGLKLPDIRLTVRKNLEKKPHPKNLSRSGIEPGPAAWQARMLPPAPRYCDQERKGATRLFHVHGTLKCFTTMILPPKNAVWACSILSKPVLALNFGPAECRHNFFIAKSHFWKFVCLNLKWQKAK